MSLLPPQKKHADPTLDALNAALEKEGNATPQRPYLGMSGIGKECKRAVWYDFRWATNRSIRAMGLRAIQDGFVNEEITAKRLRRILGIILWTEDADGRPIGCKDLSGHFRGHLDGVIEGLLQAPKTPHVWENKAVNEKKFNKLKKLIQELGEKQALRQWDIVYFVQAQLYMHYQKLKRHYLTVNTPGGRDTVTCRTEYDPEVAHHYIHLARDIIVAEAPPVRLSDDPAHWQCKFCDHHAVCHGEQLPQPTCRSCAHVTPMLDEHGGWHCRRWDDRIPEEAQRTGCNDHLFHPEIVATRWDAVKGNMAENWIQFQDKKTLVKWFNGSATGGRTSVELYAVYSSEQGQSALSGENTDEEEEKSFFYGISSEISLKSGISVETMMAGNLDQKSWGKIRNAVGYFDEQWKERPEKIARLIALINFIDEAYYAAAAEDKC